MVCNEYEYDCSNYCEEVQDVIDDYERPIPIPERKISPKKQFKQPPRRNFAMRKAA